MQVPEIFYWQQGLIVFGSIAFGVIIGLLFGLAFNLNSRISEHDENDEHSDPNVTGAL